MLTLLSRPPRSVSVAADGTPLLPGNAPQLAAASSLQLTYFDVVVLDGAGNSVGNLQGPRNVTVALVTPAVNSGRGTPPGHFLAGAPAPAVAASLGSTVLMLVPRQSGATISGQQVVVTSAGIAAFQNLSLVVVPPSGMHAHMVLLVRSILSHSPPNREPHSLYFHTNLRVFVSWQRRQPCGSGVLLAVLIASVVSCNCSPPCCAWAPGLPAGDRS